MTSFQNFADIVLANPLAKNDATALVEGGRRVSFGALRQRVLDVAAFLSGAGGLSRGDRVAVLLPNSIEFVEIYLACPASGMVIVPLNVRQLPEEQLSILADAEVSALFIAQEYAGRLKRFTDALPTLKTVVVLGAEGADRGFSSYEDIPSRGIPWSPPHVSLNDPAVLLYTSGTTALPKGAVLSHGNLLADMEQYQATVDLPPGGVNLQLSPLFHAANVFCFVHLMLGGTTVFPEKIDPAAIFSAIERERVTFLFTVPTVLYKMLDSPERHKYDLSSLKALQYGAAPITGVRLQQAIEFFGYRLMHSYGATEGSSHISILGCEDHEEAAGSAGRPLKGISVRIVDDEGRDCPAGHVGEIWVRGRNVFAGYWRRPDATREVLRDGWLCTGDLGRVDERGYLYIVDRKKDMIISGGTNIYPKEIEEVLMRYAGVAEVAVFGIPDELWGEAVAAAIVSRDGVKLDEADLLNHLRGTLGGYKVPKMLRIVGDLPKGATGKVLKRELVKWEEFASTTSAKQ